MRTLTFPLLAVLGVTSVAFAQGACSGTPDLAPAAKAAMADQAALRHIAVPHGDASVPREAADGLRRFKDDLTRTVDAVFACAPAALTPEQIAASLQRALHLQTPVTEAQEDSRGDQDSGVYGSDLGVQVFQLFDRPKLVEVDLRYGVECGDDHLLLLFEAAAGQAAEPWQLRLRWDAARYRTITDAFGDFLLMTPLPGSHTHPQWRFLVAHGEPACGETPRNSRFDLDLLTPTTEAARPAVTWHFEAGYSQGDTIPRLLTTEDTLDLQFQPVTEADSASEQKPGRHPGTATAPTPQMTRYRFRVEDGRVVPLGADVPEAAGTETQQTAPR